MAMNVEPLAVALRPLPFGGVAVELRFEKPAEERRDPLANCDGMKGSSHASGSDLHNPADKSYN
jgi:hypothetical protein